MATPTVFSYTFVDGKSIRASSGFYVAYNGAVMTINNLMVAWTALGTALQNISDAKISQGRISIPVSADAGWKAAPVGGCDVMEAGLFDFSQANTVYKQSFVVPAIGESVRDTSMGIDITDPAVKVFVNDVITSIGGDNSVFVNSKFSNDITSFLGCSVTGRTHRKQAMSKTFRSGLNYVP